MKNHAIQQYDYHRWANTRFFDHLKELPDEVYDQEIQSVFSTISEVITHIYQTDGMWLSVMAGDPFEKTMSVINQLKEKSANQSLDQMQKLYAELAKQYKAFLNEQDDLDQSMSIEHPKYGSLETSIAQLVKHVVNHGTYHRGNITAMLRQQGHAGVPTDYIFYLYEMG
ncbi:MAG: damage-inducible protein DinB [Balneolaceae bacterium]|nr:damage-inducible protein DinB [Balneolaceae bacterium]